jgi:hypothetical protein
LALCPREVGAVAGSHADEASPAEGGRSVVGDDGLPLGHDFLPLLLLRLARCAEDGFEEAAGLGGASLLDRSLELPAPGVDLARIDCLRGEAGVACLELADLLGDGAALGRRRSCQEAEGSALAADVAVIADEAVDFRALGPHLARRRSAATPAVEIGQLRPEALAFRRLGKGGLACGQEGRRGEKGAEEGCLCHEADRRTQVRCGAVGPGRPIM